MTEAAAAGIEFAFDVLKLHRIMAAYMPHNSGDWRDHVLTSLVNPRAIVPGSVVTL